MIARLEERALDFARLVRLSTRLLAGRRWWIAALAPALWPLGQAAWLALSRESEAFAPEDAQNACIGTPLTVLAIGLGVRVIAAEVDRRMLEIAYTTPGGVHRLWLAKLAGCVGILVLAEAVLATVVFALLTGFPPLALYGALQSAIFFLVVAMGFGALFRSEVTGALVSFAVMALLGMFGDGGSSWWSPFWNEAVRADANRADLLAWTLKNRIGYALAIAAAAALAFGRAERRERMLSG